MDMISEAEARIERLTAERAPQHLIDEARTGLDERVERVRVAGVKRGLGWL